jgi:hypothetical protein
MAGIEGVIVIARPVGVVFDYAADQRDEPDYNPRMVRSEKLTDGPVGQRTVFRSVMASPGRASPHAHRVHRLPPPVLLAPVTTIRQAVFRVTLPPSQSPRARGWTVGANPPGQRPEAARAAGHVAGQPTGTGDLGRHEAAAGRG